MVVCKFYLSGRCHYGKHCKFEHIDPIQDDDVNYEENNDRRNSRGAAPLQQTSNRSSVFSRLGSSNYNSQERRVSVSANVDPSRFRWVSPTATNLPPAPVQGQRRSSKINDESTAKPALISRQRTSSSSSQVVDEGTLVRRVQANVAEWRESGQWPFSSYGFKDYPSVLGFIDLQPEELRNRAYDSRKVGKMDDYETEVKNLKNAIGMRWTQLLNLSPQDTVEMMNILKPYVASAQSPLRLAKKTNETESTRNESKQPSFSFKLPPTASSTENRQPINEQKAKNPAQFSFKLPTSSSAMATATTALKTSNQPNTVYTDIKLLTDDELKAFKAKEFSSFSEIPTRPPPKELC